MARSEQTAFRILILEGPSAGAVIALEGRSLPYRSGAGGSVSYSATQRTKLTWYAGNPVASQQVIGPVLAPTTVNGVWKERYLGEDGPIQLVEAFERLLQSGAQVRVSWQTIERVGLLKSFTWKPGAPVGGLGDVEWEAVFEWSAAGRVARPRVGFGGLDVRTALVTSAGLIYEVIRLAGNLVEEGRTFVGRVRRAYEAARVQVDEVVDALARVLQTESDAAARSADAPALPASVVESASAAAGAGQARCSEMAEVSAGIFPGHSTDSDELEALLVEALARYELIDASLEAAESQFEIRRRLEGIARPVTFRRVAALPGTDLRRVALEWYGSADLWPRLARANGIDGSLIPDDVSEIVVPLTLTDATDRRVGC